MTFTEPAFATFFAIVYGLWLLCRRRHERALAVLLIGSCVFYAYERWPLLALLFSYVLVDWAVGLWIVRARHPRVALGVGLSFNLGVLACWKYAPLLTTSAAGSTVPYGLSFYAFIGTAYLVDVYRRATPAERNPLRFALFLSFFPHLIAGPILRARELLTRLQPDTMPTGAEAPREAAFLLGRGYFKKMVLADRITITVDPFFLHVGDPSTSGVWALPYVYLYALQIYLDFSGYTDIARGLALLFGFRWPENFRLPYLAASVREFWQRWHITLSLFLRDYLYIPLGGSRSGAWHTRVNIMVTFLLGGLWHGSSWTFLVWGGFHGVLLIGHRGWLHSRLRERLVSSPALASGRARARLIRAGSVVLTFHCVCIGWCFFRLTDLIQSFACLRQCVVFDAGRMLTGPAADISLWLLLGTYAAAWLAGRHGIDRALRLTGREGDAAVPFARGFAWGLSLGLLVLAVLLAPSSERPPFIYFQF